jgi:diaminopimelate epimerase
VCDRRCGVGADGVVYREELPDGGLRVRIFNADGGEAEMSGNGVRCVAALLAHEGRVHDRVRIETRAGVRLLTPRGREGNAYRFDCTMGVPILDPARIPARIEGPGPVIDHPLEVAGTTVSVTLSSMGNPHCSTFWPAVESAPVETLGAALERHAAFPNRTNVEFVQVLGPHRLRVRFWERGVGPTLASGTGSCGAALAAMLLGRVDSPVTVETALGCLEVTRLPDGELSLVGPAELVCTGHYHREGS